jgi:hypothetical protein
MNTMTLVHTTEKTDSLLTMTNTELEAWFADAGLSVETVSHCPSAGCTMCFPNRDADLLRSGTRAA